MLYKGSFFRRLLPVAMIAFVPASISILLASTFASSTTTMTHLAMATNADEHCAEAADKVAQDWDAKRYQDQHSFVYEYGSSLLQVLDPRPGERILDLGCGTGELTEEIRSLGASEAIGIDADAQMIARAQSQFPECNFMVGDARSFVLEEHFDAVFSNAALHWVPEAERAVEAIARALKPGARFVAELGGKGNIKSIAQYLDGAVGSSKNPWFFPSIAEYSRILEKHGLEVTFANLFDRPTPLENEAGLRNWILMFGNSFLEGLSEEQTEEVLAGAERELRSELYNGEQWVADYRRLRIVATKL